MRADLHSHSRYSDGGYTIDELIDVSKMGKIAVDLVDLWIKEGIETAQNKFNGKVI